MPEYLVRWEIDIEDEQKIALAGDADERAALEEWE